MKTEYTVTIWIDDHGEDWEHVTFDKEFEARIFYEKIKNEMSLGKKVIEVSEDCFVSIEHIYKVTFKKKERTESERMKE